jgi:hypothetical protein
MVPVRTWSRICPVCVTNSRTVKPLCIAFTSAPSSGLRLLPAVRRLLLNPICYGASQVTHLNVVEALNMVATKS